ncbi:hypothetical protein ABZ747_23455 [Kitasatospora cineracea]|uniref:hypothetical protein n=1 Tax=Kitasatospora cineracea TaxID=88074 RepID=UPI0033FA0F7E
MPRPAAELAPLLAWLRTGTGTGTDRRIDFPAGTALPNGRLDLCKQQLGPQGTRLVADTLVPDAAAVRSVHRRRRGAVSQRAAIRSAPSIRMVSPFR